MIELEADLKRWRQDWQVEDSPTELDVARLRRQVEWRTRGLGAYLGLTVLLVVGALAALLRLTLVRGHWSDGLLWLGLALLFGWVVVWELRSVRGLWRPEAETAAAFLDLSIRRTRRYLASHRVAAWMLAGEVGLLTAWWPLRWLESHTDEAFRLAAMTPFLQALLLVGVPGVLFLAGSRWWTRRRLDRLLALAQSLEDQPD